MEALEKKERKEKSRELLRDKVVELMKKEAFKNRESYLEVDLKKFRSDKKKFKLGDMCYISNPSYGKDGDKIRLINKLWVSSTKIEDCGKETNFYRCLECGELNADPIGCKQRLCPVCMKSRSNRMVRDLMDKFVWFWNPKLLTVTVKNFKVLTKQKIDKARKDFDNLLRRKLFKDKCRGGYYTIEIVYNNDRKDWNLHIHSLIDSYYINQAEISKVWRDITGDSWIVDIRKADHRSIFEVCKYMTKFMLKDSEIVDGYPIGELFKATRNTKLVRCFGFLRGLEIDNNEVDENNGFSCGNCGSGDLIHYGTSWSLDSDELDYIYNRSLCYIERNRLEGG